MSDQKILIVDYDAKSLEEMVDLFSSYKLEIITAVDGQEAYEKFKEEEPDLIVLEAMLPKLHGFDLTQKISKETRGSVPIVIVTGLYKGAQYKNEAIQSLGAADYFEKPFDKEKLAKTVLGLLQDEMDIQEDLPDPETVLKLLADDDESGNS